MPQNTIVFSCILPQKQLFFNRIMNIGNIFLEIHFYICYYKFIQQDELRDNMVAEKEKTEKVQKPIKKSEKFIWFLASAAIAVGGSLCHINNIRFNIWISVVYSAFLLFTIIMAAQRTSIERFGYADEEAPTADKTKYALTSILYYIFIIIAVVYAFLALWVSGVFSI